MATRSPLLLQATTVEAVRGEGCWLVDADGHRHLDFTAGIGVTSTGHCHPRVVEAIRHQAGELIHGQVTTVMHPRLDELSDALCAALPGFGSVFVANSGSEAVEAALRLARHATGRPNLVAFQGGFHGRTMGAASLTTSKLAVRAGLQPLMGGVVLAPFPYAHRYGWSEDEAVAFCLRELDHLFATTTAPSETAAIIIEPVLGEGGYVPAPDAFLRGLRERCDRHGILLVADEVQTGVGRTGRMWGMDHSGVHPDVVVVAKGLASGMPLSAIVASPELMAAGAPGSQGGTYGGNPVACAAAVATLDVVADEDLVANSATQGERLVAGVRALAAAHPEIADVRGRGLMIGVELADGPGHSAGELVQAVRVAATEAGLLTLACGASGQVLRLIPPLVVSAEEVDDGLARLAEAFDKALAGT
ncbi:aspartate aminotransferase family protein [Rhabdothermincola salaria]|uniref:aspartate aminotransferase family protein n=1 Tax=Rhabdothermincola salaria TaxID=2903142 RepID=UPI001E2D1993|nr:aminotransferase class III-fold pyridoxal phosphate-dependent enzyme [Rhabdothermincola salaria]MCD9625311.1 aminotransferase class III-fold pyridoxal phosphate-dependent enzyme [Rhabdothermincola salaria]